MLPVLGLIAVVLYRPEADEPERRCPRCGKVHKLYVQVCTRCGAGPYLPDPSEVRHPAVLPARRPGSKVSLTHRSQVSRSRSRSRPVADHGGLLRVAVHAAGDGHRHLLGGNAAPERLDQELRGVELLLAQDELRQDV